MMGQPLTFDAALAALQALSDPQKAAELAQQHRVERPYLGVPTPAIDALCKTWRAQLTLEARLALCEALWDSNIHEARIAAAKLLTQARIRPDEQVWALITSWVPAFDGWAIADQVAVAGQKRLVANPDRLDTLQEWTKSPHMWTRRATLVMTLSWTKQNHPKPEDLAVRERVLDWAAVYVDEKHGFIQKAVAWWLRDLSKHDPARVRAFLDLHGETMKPYARTEASRNLPPVQ